MIGGAIDIASGKSYNRGAGALSFVKQKGAKSTVSVEVCGFDSAFRIYFFFACPKTRFKSGGTARARRPTLKSRKDSARPQDATSRCQKEKTPRRGVAVRLPQCPHLSQPCVPAMKHPVS